MNMNIITFLDGLPEGQKFEFEGRILLSKADPYLGRSRSGWACAQDEKAIEAMKRAERSPYACIGPANAFFGSNGRFLQAPALRWYSPAKGLQLEGVLTWREDGGELSPEVKELAESLVIRK